MDERKIDDFFAMTRIIVIITLFCVANAKALSTDILYYVQYPVSEIEGFYNGKIIDEEKGTCSFPLDILSTDGFILLEDSIPTQSVVDSLLDGNSGCLLNRINIVTPYNMEFPFMKGMTMDVIKKNQAVINGMTTFSPLFMSSDRKYLYRFLQIKATLEEFISPTEEIKIPKESPKKDNMSYSEDECYYVSDVFSFNPYVVAPKSSVWYPFKSYFEKNSREANFKALYVLKYNLPYLKDFYENNLSEGRIPTFADLMTLPQEGALIEIASDKDIEKVVKGLLLGEGFYRTHVTNYIFPFLKNRIKDKKLPFFYNIGPCENLGIKCFRAMNTRTIIESDLALAPYIISEDGLSVYKIIYIEGTFEVYNEHRKKNLCYIVNIPRNSDKHNIDIISGLTYSTPYVCLYSNKLWVPDISPLSVGPEE